MKRAIIMNLTTNRLPITAEELLAAAQKRWPGRVKEQSVERTKIGGSVWVEPEGEPPFHVDLGADSKSIFMDGLPEQNIAVAAWVRSLLPDDGSRLIVCDQAWTVHAELPVGSTAESIKATLVDHSVPGWDENDPDLRY